MGIIEALKKAKASMQKVGDKIKADMKVISNWFKEHFTKEKMDQFIGKIKEVVQKVINLIPDDTKEEIKEKGKERAQDAMDELEKAISEQIDKAIDRLNELISGKTDEKLLHEEVMKYIRQH